MNFPFAQRTRWTLGQNALMTLMQELRQKGEDIIDLTESNPTACGLNYPQDLPAALSQPVNLQYTPDSKGLFSARQAVSELYDRRIPPEHIILTSSTSEAYSFLFRLLVNPGERILLPRPSYPLFEYLVDLNDAQAVFYPLVYDNGWQIDFVALEDKVDSLTRAIVLVNPNNPTGSFLKTSELERLNAFCLKHRLSIISDEVFFDYRLTNATAELQSCVANAVVPTFVLGGLSKSLGLPQMKLSWIISSGPEAILDEALNRLDMIADTYLSVNTPVQNALPVWLRARDNLQAMIKERVEANYRCLTGRLPKSAACRHYFSEGGWYAVLSIPRSRPEEEWVLTFLREDRTLVHPGYFFDFDHEAFIVLSLLPDPQRFQTGVERILKRLE